METAAGGHEVKDMCGGGCSRFYIRAWEKGGVLNNLLPGEEFYFAGADQRNKSADQKKKIHTNSETGVGRET